jgi:CheY-like chemotaxis protein/HPt (histidine-containing phosphotransfer) domain-containing protein
MPVMDGFEVAERIRAQPGYAGTPLMILTSSGLRGDATRCRDLGIAAYLTKPVKQSSLLDAVTTVLGTTEPAGAEAPLVTQHSLKKALHPLRVLLAEDNAVNCRIATRMLEKQGHRVVSAENGREALAALKAQGEQPFDLILMDVQMPELDGFEATAMIRQQERASGGHIPIIALTAHTMKGDREACLQAGMDGYVAKPLKREDLFAAIEKVVASQPETVKVKMDRDRDKGAVFNPKQLLASVDGDNELLQEVIDLFLEEIPKNLAEIHDAIAEGDAARLQRTAHALKGSVSNFGSPAAVDLALKLEMLGKDRELSGALDVFSSLAAEMNRLQVALADYAGEEPYENPDSRR